MGDYKIGDRVSVAGLEGRVNYINNEPDLVDITFDGQSYTTDFIPTSIVVKLASPLKVGDVIRHFDYSSVPTGTVVASHSNSMRPGLIRLSNGDWYDIRSGRSFTPDDLSSERKILFLPES